MNGLRSRECCKHDLQLGVEELPNPLNIHAGTKIAL
jgi:hypothetical protein